MPVDHSEIVVEERRSFSDWLPLAIVIFGMVIYTSITKSLAVVPEQLDFARLRSAQTVTGEAAALIQFRGVAALALTIALASTIVSVSLMVRYLGRSKLHFHLAVLAGLVLLAVALNAFGPSRATDQLLTLLCRAPDQALAFGEVYRFCESPNVIGPFVSGGSASVLGLNLRLLINLPLAAAAACIAYAAFSLAADRLGKVDWPAREKIIALLMGFGAAVLVSSTLLDREYARWAFSGTGATDDTRAFIDGHTFYAGATSSALLAMIWLFAMGLLLWRRDSGPGREITLVLSRQSSIFAFLSVIAPTMFAIVERLF